MVTTKKYIMVKHFDGLPKLSDFEIVEEVLPSLKDGGKHNIFLCHLTTFFLVLSRYQ